MSKTSATILIIIIVILAATNAYAAYKYFASIQALELANRLANVRTTNNRVIDFTKLVIDKVLHADKGVSFEDRLQLENEVRGLNDEQILKKWNSFVGSKTQEEAQNNLRDLLSMLINKVRPE